MHISQAAACQRDNSEQDQERRRKTEAPEVSVGAISFPWLAGRYCYMPDIFSSDILKAKKDEQFTASGNDARFPYRTSMGLAEDKEVGTNKCLGEEWWRLVE